MVDRRMKSKLDHYDDVVIYNEKKLKLIESYVPTDSKSKEILSEILNNTDLSVIRELSLDSKELSYLPEEFEVRLEYLEKLDLSNNKIKTLPQSLQCLKQLNCLILNDNNLIDVPLIITKISSLKMLKLARNKIEILPENLGDLRFLETLDLSSNRLSTIPNSFATLNQLKTLNLSENCFKMLPECVTNGMISLELLDLSSNVRINLRNAPASKKLKSLYLKNLGETRTFPAWLLRGSAPDLRLLECDGTNFKHADFLANHNSLKLKTLSLINCSVFDKFVNNITRLTDELETLRIGNLNCKRNHNGFWKLPIKNLHRPMLLTELSVRETGLPNVSREIGKLVNLVKLELSDNKIYSLPKEICCLDKLSILLVDKNYLHSLPDDIGSMISLKEIKANNNHIARLPKSVIKLKQLLHLDLYQNEFEEVPKELDSIESLIGVDIEENNFDTDALRIKDVPYETLRCCLRDRSQGSEYANRTNGRRYTIEADQFLDSQSDISSMTSDKPETTYIAVENVSREDENWDISEDSADDFDPTCPQEPSRRYVNGTRIPVRTGFCPDDLHAVPIKRQIAAARRRGDIKNIEIVEGQFDDA